MMVFNIFQLASLMTAAFFLGVVAYMVMPAVSIILFSVVPPETKATTISASNVVLNLVIALLSLMIGIVSDATELRLAFGGAVILMFALGILVSLALLRTIGKDIDRFAFTEGSDHWPFHAAGIPAIDLWSSNYRIMNSAADTPEKVDPVKIERLALALAKLLTSVPGVSK